MLEEKSRRKIKPKSNIFKIGKTWYLRYRIKTVDGNSKLVRQSLHTSNKVEAEKKKEEMLTAPKDMKTAQDVIHKVARAKEIYSPKQLELSLAIKEFETHPALRKPSMQTMQAYKHWIKNFINWIETNHHIRYLSDIDCDIAREYAKQLYSEKVSNKTFNEVINTLARLFEVLKDIAGINKNPFSKDIIVRLSKEAISRKELTKEQANTILNSFREIKDLPFSNEYELLFYMGLYTGTRLKDACLLKWEDVSFNQNIISIEPYKTKRYGTKVQIPISQWLLPKLLEAKEIYSSEYVLPNLSQTYINNRHIVNKNIRRIFSYNGLTAIDDSNSQRQVAASVYSFHSLRYCFVSFCAEAGVPMALVQDIVGHLNPAMTKHYTRFSNEYKQKAIQGFRITPAISENSSTKTRLIQFIQTATDEQLQQAMKIFEKGEE